MQIKDMLNHAQKVGAITDFIFELHQEFEYLKGGVITPNEFLTALDEKKQEIDHNVRLIDHNTTE